MSNYLHIKITWQRFHISKVRIMMGLSRVALRFPLGNVTEALRRVFSTGKEPSGYLVNKGRPLQLILLRLIHVPCPPLLDENLVLLSKTNTSNEV